MKAPKYQRSEMLEAALHKATETLKDPVEGLEITGQGVVAWSAGRFILMTYRWDNEYAENGGPLLGAGAWSAQYAFDCDASFRLSPDRITPIKSWLRYWWRPRKTGGR